MKREVAVHALIASMAYKAGWTLRFAPIDEVGLLSTYHVGAVQITAPAQPDSAMGIGDGTRRINVPIGRHDTDAEIMHNVFIIIQSMELHECAEWFRCGGERPFNPHAAVRSAPRAR